MKNGRLHKRVAFMLVFDQCRIFINKPYEPEIRLSLFNEII